MSKEAIAAFPLDCKVPGSNTQDSVQASVTVYRDGGRDVGCLYAEGSRCKILQESCCHYVPGDREVRKISELNLPEFGKRTVEYRSFLGLRQSQVAIIIGMSKSMVNIIENGRRNPSIKTLIKLTDALKIPLKEQAEYFALAGRSMEAIEFERKECKQKN